MSGWRAFIAAELDSPLKAALAEAARALGEIPAVRASVPDGIHLTIHFLGNVDPPVLDELADRIRPVVAQLTPFRVEVRGVGAFPTRRRPQVFYAGLDADALPPLRALHESTRPAIEAVGLAPEGRRFTPHLTLGRVRHPVRGEDARRVEAWLRTHEGERFGVLPVQDVVLMRSELGAGPPRYTVLQRFAFADR